MHEGLRKKEWTPETLEEDPLATKIAVKHMLNKEFGRQDMPLQTHPFIDYSALDEVGGAETNRRLKKQKAALQTIVESSHAIDLLEEEDNIL